MFAVSQKVFEESSSTSKCQLSTIVGVLALLDLLSVAAVLVIAALVGMEYKDKLIIMYEI